jgi:hypothetical protein
MEFILVLTASSRSSSSLILTHPPGHQDLDSHFREESLEKVTVLTSLRGTLQ